MTGTGSPQAGAIDAGIHGEPGTGGRPRAGGPPGTRGRALAAAGLGAACLSASAILIKLAKQDGVDLEVIDLRSLVPLDTETVLSSVARTGRLLVVDEDYQSFGLSGEIAARVAETDPGLLRAPLRRVAVPDVPIPYARSLEQAVLPTPERIEAAVRDLVKV